MFNQELFFPGCRVQIREYHRRHPSVREATTADDPEEYLKEEPYIDFSGEVVYCRTLSSIYDRSGRRWCLELDLIYVLIISQLGIILLQECKSTFTSIRKA